MFKKKLSRRDFLKGVGVSLAALNLPAFPNRIEAAPSHSGTNPYIKYVDGKRILEPATAEKYLKRKKNFPYKIDKKSLPYRLFTQYGFEWGGNWSDRKDYQHFELPTSITEILYPNNR